MDRPVKFSKEDVRNQLSELGYSNIEDSKLEEFCQDLKRLIKYEEKRSNVDHPRTFSELQDNLCGRRHVYLW